MSRKLTILFHMLFSWVLISCAGSASEVRPTRADTQNISPAPPHAITPSPTSSVTPTPPATPSLAPSPLPDDLSESIKQSYLAIFLIRVDAELVNEAADRTQSGDLTGFDQVGALLAIAAVMEGVDQSLPEITPPEPLQTYWEEARSVHEQTKEILGDWFNDELDSAEVLIRMESVLLTAEGIIENVEETLARDFGFDLEQLTEERQEILESLPEIFESTSTPSA